MTDHESGAAAESVIGQATQSVFADLIARLEKATGPSRELDARIQRIVGPGPWHIGCGGLTNAFTASIDAALTLVPEDFDWIVARTNGGLTIHACCGGTKEYFGETPAIALCIAALKARAA